MVKVAYTFSEYSNDWWTDNVIDNVFQKRYCDGKSDINDINVGDDALLPSEASLHTVTICHTRTTTVMYRPILIPLHPIREKTIQYCHLFAANNRFVSTVC